MVLGACTFWKRIATPCLLADFQHPNANFKVQVWKLGTAFSGMETIAFSLHDLGITQYEHAFCVEKNKACRRFIEQNVEIDKKIIFEDITTTPARSLPSSDVYVAGFPCIAFSTAGLGRDSSAPDGKYFDYCADYIEHKAPGLFILENVPPLAQSARHRPYWHHIVKRLFEINNEMYHCNARIVCTNQNGLPQTRKRLYLVGLKKTACNPRFQFRWPAAIPTQPIASLLDMDDQPFGIPQLCSQQNKLVLALGKMRASGINGIRRVVFVDILEGRKDKVPHWSFSCPTITRQRGSGGGFWITKLGRFTSVAELCRLQGFEMARFSRAGISDRQVKMMVVWGGGSNMIKR